MAIKNRPVKKLMTSEDDAMSMTPWRKHKSSSADFRNYITDLLFLTNEPVLVLTLGPVSLSCGQFGPGADQLLLPVI